MLYDKWEQQNNFGTKIENGYELSVLEKTAWQGINLTYRLDNNSVYLVSFEAMANNDQTLLEVILPTEKEEIRVRSFTVSKNKDNFRFFLTPLADSTSISFRMSTFGKFSTGTIQIRNIVVRNIFPITDNDDLKEKIHLIGPWFHQIVLGGIRTRDIHRTDSPSTKDGFNEKYTMQDYIDNPMWIWTRFKNHISKDLSGKEVLDVACNSGFYSIKLAQRGAKVIGIDNSYHDIVQAKFARKILEIENIEFMIGDAYKLDKIFNKKFDLILCLGLLYHLWEPQKVIDSISNLTDFAVFETIADVGKTPVLMNEPAVTNDGYLPSITWLFNAFKSAGFSQVEKVTPDGFGRNIFICKR